MSELITCAKCRAELRGGESSCPRCLLSNALEPSNHTERGPGFLDDLQIPVDEIETHVPVQAQGVSSPTIGRYKLLEQIGEGGFGVVWMAEQREPIKRRVALKILKLGMDTGQVVARFEAERQALAIMEHANIAKVLDAAATETGRPYFVMELVRGIPITTYCDKEKLGTRARLDLFIKVCHAIQHAHQKGIIHRDIKPSNILVTLHDGQPVPKVIDFGIAKATQGELTDKTMFTAFEQFMGTPAYMSPEQAGMSGLDIDTRSDIYSLGVLLYELLAGFPPFDPKQLAKIGVDEIRKTIREVEPATPSTRFATLSHGERATTAASRGANSAKLIHQIKGDLDWIVMKCLEKDRARRFETVDALASDLQRHLENEPVLARPPSLAYRVQKSWRRIASKPAVAVLSGLVLLLVLGVMIGSPIAIARISAERDRANLIAEAEEIARRDAEAEKKKAEAARDLAAKSAESERAAKAEAIQRGEEARRANEEAELQRENATKALTKTILQTGNAMMNRDDSQGAIAYLASYLRLAPNNKPVGLRLTSALADGNLVFPIHLYGESNFFGSHIPQEQYISSDGQQLITISSNRLYYWDPFRESQLPKSIAIEPSQSRTMQFSLNGRKLLAISYSADSLHTKHSTGIDGARDSSRLMRPEREAIWFRRSGSDLARPKTWGELQKLLTAMKPLAPSNLRLDHSEPASELPTTTLERFEPTTTLERFDFDSKKDTSTRVVIAGVVFWAQLSPDGELAFVRMYDGNAALFSLTNAMQIQSFPNSPSVLLAEFSPDNRWLLTATRESAVIQRVDDIRETIPPVPLESSHPLASVSFSQDSLEIAATLKNGQAVVFDCETGKELWKINPLGKFLTSATLTPDKAFLLTLDPTNGLSYWKKDSQKPMWESLSIEDTITSAEFDASGTRILTLSRSGVSQILEAETGTPICKSIARDQVIEKAHFTHKNDSVLLVDRGGVATGWRIARASEFSSLLHTNLNSGSTIDPTNSALLITLPTNRGLLGIWNGVRREYASYGNGYSRIAPQAAPMPVQRTLQNGFEAPTSPPRGFPFSISILSPQKSELVGEIRPFPLLASQLLPPLPSSTINPFSVSIWPLQFPVVPISRDILKANVYGPRTLRNSENFRERLIAFLIGGQGITSSLIVRSPTSSLSHLKMPSELGVQLIPRAFSRDLRRIAAIGTDRMTYRPNQELTPAINQEQNLGIYGNNNKPVCLLVWDWASGDLISKSVAHPADSLAISPDGSRLASTSGGSAWLWDINNDLKDAEKISANANYVEFVQDGRQLITCSKEGNLRVWDVQTRKPVSEELPLGIPVAACEVSSDGKLMIVADLKGGIRIWDIDTTQPVSERVETKKEILKIAFGVGENELYIVCADDVLSWSLPPRSARIDPWFLALAEAMACQRLDDRGVAEPFPPSRVMELAHDIRKSSSTNELTKWAKRLVSLSRDPNTLLSD